MNAAVHKPRVRRWPLAVKRPKRKPQRRPSGFHHVQERAHGRRRIAIMTPHAVRYRQKIGPRIDQRASVGGRYPANGDARNLEYPLPPFQYLGLGKMIRSFGRGREKCTKGNIARPSLARFHRQMAAGVTRHANLGVGAQDAARVDRVAVALPQMHAVGFQPFCEPNIVIDDERDVMVSADVLQGSREPGGFVLVDAFDAKLERRDGPSFQCSAQLVGKVPADVQRRHQIKLANRRAHPMRTMSGDRGRVNGVNGFAQRGVKLGIGHLRAQIFEQRAAETGDDAAVFGEFGARLGPLEAP